MNENLNIDDVEILGDLVPGTWHKFNDKTVYLHRIRLLRISGETKIWLLLENHQGKYETLLLPVGKDVLYTPVI